MDNIPCTYRISVKAIISDKHGKILLLREQNGSWELPGGGLEHGEDVQTALAREVGEETGMQVLSVSDRPLRAWTIYKEVGSPSLKWFAFIVYEVVATGKPKIGLTDEAIEARYFSREEARQLLLHDNTAPFFS